MTTLKPLQGLAFVVMTGFLLGCRVSAPLATLPADFYQITDATQPQQPKQKVYVIDSGDTIQLIIPATDGRCSIHKSTYSQWIFHHTQLDVDVFTLPFKIRPSQARVPTQLNSDFNAALYVGRRIDNYTYNWKPITPTFAIRQLRGRGFGYGFFAGIGSVAMSNDVTRTPISIGYQGVVLDAGVATIYDARLFNIGLAIGADYLIDPNRQRWIYQQKPWVGVLFGLNLN